MPSTLILGAAILIFLGGGAALVVALRGEPTSDSRARLIPQRPSQDLVAGRSAPDASDPSPLLTRVLERLGVAKRIQWKLLKAGLLLKPCELLVLVLAIAAAGYAIGLALKGMIAGLLLGGAGAMLPLLYINMRIARRGKLLAVQLPDALSMMSSSLRSGYSFMRAMQVVSDEMDPPVAEELGRVLDELNVGISQERALAHLYERCPSGDIDLVVTACQIQFTVGGNLAEILDTTAEMIRERVRLQSEISALTGEGRLSAGILTGLPIFLAIVVSRMSPGYLSPLFNTHQGIVMLCGAIGAMLMGIAVIKKMLAVQI